MSTPTRTEQLDPDCPDDLRADSGVAYNPPMTDAPIGLKKGDTVILRGFKNVPEKAMTVTEVNGDSISLDIPF